MMAFIQTYNVSQLCILSSCVSVFYKGNTKSHISILRDEKSVELIHMEHSFCNWENKTNNQKTWYQRAFYPLAN